MLIDQIKHIDFSFLINFSHVYRKFPLHFLNSKMWKTFFYVWHITNKIFWFITNIILISFSFFITVWCDVWMCVEKKFSWPKRRQKSKRIDWWLLGVGFCCWFIRRGDLMMLIIQIDGKVQTHTHTTYFFTIFSLLLIPDDLMWWKFVSKLCFRTKVKCYWLIIRGFCMYTHEKFVEFQIIWSSFLQETIYESFKMSENP